MLDARIFPTSLESAKKILVEKGAVFKGEYEIHDIIFSSKNPDEDLNKVYLRLRLVPVNIWSEKSVIVSVKNTELKEVGKESTIPIKQQFDTESEAREFIENNYNNNFEFAFEFNRIGWQYNLNEDQIDLENIEGHYSIEFKSKTENSLKNLLGVFNINSEEVIKGPSVIAVRDILKH